MGFFTPESYADMLQLRHPQHLMHLHTNMRARARNGGHCGCKRVGEGGSRRTKLRLGRHSLEPNAVRRVRRLSRNSSPYAALLRIWRREYCILWRKAAHAELDGAGNRTQCYVGALMCIYVCDTDRCSK